METPTLESENDALDVVIGNEDGEDGQNEEGDSHVSSHPVRHEPEL